MVDETIDQPYVEEEQISDALNNLTNDVTSDAIKLTNLTTDNSNIAVQIKVALYQNKGLTDLPTKKIWGLSVTNSDH